MSESDQFLREVSEEFKKDQYLKFWKMVAPYVIGVAVVVILVTSGAVGWQSYRENRDRAWGERYSIAMQLANEGNTRLAIEQFSRLASEATPGSGYATLAMIQEAALLADGRQIDVASDIYRRLLDQADDPSLRDLVILLRAMTELDTAEPADLRASLEPLAAEDSPWRFSAREFLAYLAGRQGNRTLQIEILKQLAGDSLTPQGIYVRSKDMLSILGVHTDVDTDSNTDANTPE